MADDNLIPILTGYNSNGVIIKDNGYAYGPRYGWRVFSRIEGNQYNDDICYDSSSNPGILTINFNELGRKRVNKYTIRCSRNTTIVPYSWSLQSSNDGITWITLDTRNNVGPWSEKIKKSFIISNNKYYQYYRFVINSNGRFLIAAIELLHFDFVLIKQNNQFYTIKPDQYQNSQFQPLAITTPTVIDYETFGFSDVNLLTQIMTVGTETFRPVDKFDKTKPLEIYKCIEK